MSPAAADIMVARCGLVCTHCGAFKAGRCRGCHGDKPMFRCCPVRACVLESNLITCADCTRHADLKRCRRLHSFISRLFGLIFRSDRIGNLERIREIGLPEFKSERARDQRK